MVSDSELIERLREFLSTSDLNTTTTAIVRRRLEQEFDIDLSDRKAFIREQVDVYMQSQFESVANNEDEINDEGAAELAEEEEEEEEVEEEEEGEEESVSSSNPKASTKKRSKKKKEVKKRSGGGGFTKLCTLSPELQKFTGVPELARTEVVRQLWSYIKENNLQDPSNRRTIICDDTLRNLFEVDSIDMFQMNKSLAKHIWPLGSDSAPVNAAPVEKRKQERDEDEEEPERKEKRPRGAAFLVPLKLSDALVKFLGTGESELPRSNVVKRIWDYIKLNNLQDPSDKRQILCDEKLKELFNVDTFHGFTVAKLLTAHIIKPEK
ncbi:hypothetical protein ABFS82_08G046500 [Erythranthe guttata]|uniref:upstream activation factor subunit spp27-like isoform X2 n=1 Tax=Erythranthe guttata TaxID=4155 RepID=UPI00064E07D4|nr:PREDICTED: upstream activation factor subunit spp27-like isoform X2 [Erythranthe guttata]|eukprot:XP_012853096.1 PREDICTED: upstream activation factor subunit spp27-like isoform X2 [Erythranthe guttata]